jgi:hypothetical protein
MKTKRRVAQGELAGDAVCSHLPLSTTAQSEKAFAISAIKLFARCLSTSAQTAL